LQCLQIRLARAGSVGGQGGGLSIRVENAPANADLGIACVFGIDGDLFVDLIKFMAAVKTP
jgi:hypothetical protein